MRGLWSSELDLADLVMRVAKRLDQPIEMGAIAGLALDIGNQTLGGQRGEYALMIDLDDVGTLLIEDPRDIVERAGLILQTDAQTREPARAGEIAQQHVGEQAGVDIAAAQHDAAGLALEPLGIGKQRRE